MELPQKRYNEEFIDILEQLAKLLAQQGEPFRARAYKKAEETIREMSDTNITSVDDLRDKPNIGKTIIEKLQEYVNTGKISVLEREKGKPEYIFSEIHGIGPKKARDLVKMGITTIAQLKERQNEVLNDVQRKGLKYFDDIQKRIPRSEIDEYRELFEGLVGEDIKMEIVGSYRRGLMSSGDIDVILTSSQSSDFETFLKKLRESGIILEILACGGTKCLVIARLPEHDIARRVDFMYTPKEEFPFAILYFTGSKTFNTIMRGNALKKGFSLNEHGLYVKKPGQKKEEKISEKFYDERDIFNFLGMKYKHPKERGNQWFPPTPSFTKEPSIMVEKLEEEKIDDEDFKKEIMKEKVKDKEIIQEKIAENITELIPVIPTEKTRKKRGRKAKEKISNGSPKVTKKRGRPPKDLSVKLIKGSPKGTKKKRAMKKTANFLKELKVPKITIDVKNQPDLENIPLPTKTIFDKEKQKTQKKRGRPPKVRPEAPIIPIIPLDIKEEKKSPNKIIIKGPKFTIKRKIAKGNMESREGVVGETYGFPTINKIDENKIKTISHNKTIKRMSSKTASKKHISEFKLSGIKVLDGLSEQEITNVIVTANDAYYNKKPLLTDNEYDIIREYAENKYPDNTVIREVGAPITKNKVTLPYNMPSMDKIKPDTNALGNWTAKYKGPYVLSCKLDGVSGMYIAGKPKVSPATPSSSTDTLNGEPKLYTRGDGKVGQDITHLLKVLKLPDVREGVTGGTVGSLVVRGEFIIPKRVFEEKYKSQFANPRNLVSGIVNSKTLDEKTRDLHFVAYEVINPPMKVSEQMDILKECGFEVVQNRRVDELSNKILSETLLDWRSTYEYEIDGVIVADDHIHPRKDGNPEYAFAFKMVISDQMAEAKVVDVLWEPSKSGYLKPRVQIEPIQLSGVTIQYATGFNGQFIESNKIGIGAVIQIIRSGDVIPHIKSVTTPAERAKMPDVAYTWTKNHVDIVLENVEEDVTVRRKNITEFFKWLEVDGLSGKTVEKIMEAGFDTVPRILKMTKADFAKVRGFKDTMINKIHDGIKSRVEGASLLDIMVASNMFGRGISEKKLKPIMTEYPDVLTSTESKEEKYSRIIKIKGIGTENTQSFIDGIDRFMVFLKECNLEDKLHKKTEEPKEPVEKKDLDKSHPLYEKHIVMTKIRDKDIKEKLEAVGGVLDDNVGRNTFALIVKTKADESNKTKYAKEHNIPIYEPSEFLEKYF